MSGQIWLTGFGPFPGVPDNPTAAIVRALNGREFGHLRVVGEELPVSFRRAAERIAAGYHQLKPVAALHLGVQRQGASVRVERIAINERSTMTVDVDGEQPFGEVCDRAYAAGDQLESRVDVGIVAANIRRAALPAESSDDAGRYVCNSTYFAALAAARKQYPVPPVLFVHIPRLGAARGVGGACWHTADLETVARIALQHLADQATGRITGPLF